jgi:hypothetical protein
MPWFKWLAGLTSLFVVQVALATQPTPPKVHLSANLMGAVGTLQVENLEKFPLTLEVYAGSLSSVQFSPTRAQIAAGQKAQIKLEKVVSRGGLQVLHIQTFASVENRSRFEGPSLYQPFMISGREAKPMTYEQAFLNRRERIEGKSEVSKIDLGGVSYSTEVTRQAFKAGAIPDGMKIEPFSYRDAREYAKLPLRQLPKDIQLGGQGREGLFSVDEAGNESAYEIFDRSNEEASSISPFGFTIKGRMSLKTAPSTYKAAWGWVVRAWQQVGGVWIFLGWTYVGGDGSWQITLPTAVPGIPVRVEYQTKNRFVSVQDPAGNAYTWGDNWSLTGSVTDIGSRYADLTVNGDLPGVDRLYVGATMIWVKFYNNGMNALRDKPIQVTFPNSLASGQCIYNNGSGPYAWSCSYWADGRIYIIPAHGSESVVQHEIAHSINSFYWNGSMPPGSGGTHNLWDCYNNGLALTEGWANFVTYWTQFDRTKASPMAPYFNMNLETLPSGVCANQTAEMRVASTFWDMYDTLNDGPSATERDALNYVSQAVPVWIYLGNKRTSMAEYLPVVQAGQSAFWQGEFTKLFRLGKIVP